MQANLRVPRLTHDTHTQRYIHMSYMYNMYSTFLSSDLELLIISLNPQTKFIANNASLHHSWLAMAAAGFASLSPGMGEEETGRWWE